jgi:ribokinase
VGGDGENVIVVIAGANGQVTVQDARDAIAAMSTADTVLLQMEIPEAAVRAALEASAGKGRSQHSQHRTADRCGGAACASG